MRGSLTGLGPLQAFAVAPLIRRQDRPRKLLRRSQPAPATISTITAMRIDDSALRPRKSSRAGRSHSDECDDADRDSTIEVIVLAWSSNHCFLTWYPAAAAHGQAHEDRHRDACEHPEHRHDRAAAVGARGQSHGQDGEVG